MSTRFHIYNYSIILLYSTGFISILSLIAVNVRLYTIFGLVSVYLLEHTLISDNCITKYDNLNQREPLGTSVFQF